MKRAAGRQSIAAAGKNINIDACRKPAIVNALNKHGFVLLEDIPIGSILATCQLQHCYNIRSSGGEDGPAWLDRDGQTLGWAGLLPPEYYFGDYSDGRYAWGLTEIERLEDPMPATGQFGLWEYKGSVSG